MDSYSFFLKADLSKYVDKWIAIVDSRVVSSGKKAKETYEEAKKKYPMKRPLLAKVPSKKTMIFLAF